MTRHSSTLAAISAACFVACSHVPTNALTINLNFRDSSSDAPSFDPTGEALISIMTAAAAEWEDIIEDDHTLSIDYWWDDLSATTLALHQLTGQSGGRETRANIRFDTMTTSGERPWFLDPTPTLDEEFNIQQTLYRDLSSSAQSSGFSTDAPGVLEVGYRGTAPTGSPAIGRFDLLSVAQHEIGHALGLSSANFSTISETSDNDYDSPSELLNGTSVGIKTASSSNIAHLASSDTLLFSFTSSSTRTRPSTTDVFASAAGSDWTDIDLPRQDLLTGTNFHTPSNWTGNSVPDADDLAAIRSDTPANVTLVADTTVSSLIIDNGSRLDTNSQNLTSDTVTIGPESKLTVIDSTLQTNTLTVDPSGIFELGDAGTLATETVNGNLSISAGTIAPGKSPGITAVTGSFSMSDNATYTVEIAAPDAAPVAGLDFDQITVDNDASLGGTLAIRMISELFPELGTEFPILRFDSATGAFDTIEGAVLDTTMAFAPLFNETDVTLRASIPGDLNFDNKVSLSDLSTFALNFNTVSGIGSWHLGDFNSDGSVTTSDLSLLALNFGFDLEAGIDPTGLSIEDAATFITAIGTGDATLPEPATATLTTCLFTALLTKRKRH